MRQITNRDELLQFMQEQQQPRNKPPTKTDEAKQDFYKAKAAKEEALANYYKAKAEQHPQPKPQPKNEQRHDNGNGLYLIAYITTLLTMLAEAIFFASIIK